MTCKIKKVRIVNFKSFKDVTVQLKQFNVLIGPNASGKTNFIEFFKFLKRALVEPRRPYIPYIEWWSYRNLVWNGKEELPIEAEIECEIDGYQIKYAVSFSGIGGTFRILHEQLDIKDYLLLERDGELLRVSYDKNFLSKNASEFEKLKNQMNKTFGVELHVRELLERTTSLPRDFWNLLHLPVLSLPPYSERSEINCGIVSIYIKEKLKDALKHVPLIVLPKNKKFPPFVHPLTILLNEFNDALSGFTILRHPNMQNIRIPSPPRETRILSEDASNLSNVLNAWFTEKLKFPERIEVALLKLFPNTQVATALTPQGEIFIKVYEGGVELNPPCISDGFYKVLAILTAIESRPSLLAIDEIENSLHAKTLEYIIDELKSSGVTVVITTHSPVVVDMVALEDLLIVEKTPEGTKLTPVKEPEEVRKKLKELDITQSESWLYGELAK